MSIDTEQYYAVFNDKNKWIKAACQHKSIENILGEGKVSQSHAYSIISFTQSWKASNKNSTLFHDTFVNVVVVDRRKGTLDTTKFFLWRRGGKWDWGRTVTFG